MTATPPKWPSATSPQRGDPSGPASRVRGVRLDDTAEQWTQT